MIVVMRFNFERPYSLAHGTAYPHFAHPKLLPAIVELMTQALESRRGHAVELPTHRREEREAA